MREKRGPWTIVGTKIAYKDDWIAIRRDKVITPGGARSTYATLVAKDGAIVVPVDEVGNVYLGLEFRYALGRENLEIPGGALDPGEGELEGAKRELREEAGISAERWTHLTTSHVFHSLSPAVAGIYLAEGLSFAEQKLDHNERIELRKMPLAEALRLIDAGEITDTLTIAGLLFAARHLAARAKE
jgi:8-oxo-dGTP pyrophosphatase MutT (NUDIX family)